ncbi:MAG TPA: hypothetical protein VEV45_09315 [Streptosporangiaceae bacterium]|nr:hypothetical protein [Streptosporangiaceae bacterium]
MTNTAITTDDGPRSSNEPSQATRQLSALLCAAAASAAVAGIATGLATYLHRSPIRHAHVPGTSAWVQHLAIAAAACALYGVVRWRRARRPRRGTGRLLLLAPLGSSAASRLAATMRQVTWRSAATLPLLAVIAYSFWRAGVQVTGGLDPNFTVNAWGGPTYLGAMACHYLDGALIIAVSGWLLSRIMLRPPSGRADGSIGLSVD